LNRVREVGRIAVDSGNPTLATKELGGTGRRHDWTISVRIREQVGIPVFLAGGLNPGNAAEAVETVRPFGLDVCTGVRRNDFALDRSAVERFATAIRPH
jgi:phosphoribosylanthranilate isomerase